LTCLSHTLQTAADLQGGPVMHGFYGEG